ncbi:type VI secretion system protein TssA [Acidisoma cellulosilytica]|uniref:Type VI secretion system protein TssA n=1 Tax=Acidisoma cellulosilyticum TaxID=2802395 RepID=A0A963Z1T0_9PROT|nr:type VI secretion system protein TssA [Acidisoma cellulosilyticum]MCB8881046.1 type VI secretion system protein TssA [Acidisoma cellulosilyticum]
MDQNLVDPAQSLMSALLKPFGPDAPAGLDPREDTSPLSRYFRLRDARADARAGERSSDHGGRSASTDSHWLAAEEHARLILTENGKDLEVAAWMTEALVRRHALPGLAFGAELMTGLVTQFWSDGLFPANDDDSEDPRGIPLAGLNGVSGDGTLLQSLRMVVLFHRSDQTPVTLWQYEQAEEIEGIGDAARKKRRLAAGVLPLGELDSDARLVGQTHLRMTGHDAKMALAWWERLAGAMADALGREAPPSRRVATVLEKIIRIAAKLAPEATPPRLVEADTTEAMMDSAPAHADVSEETATEKAADKTPVTRDSMLTNLLVVAEYFRMHEPHSPLSYALEEAVRRARLSFFELLEEVVPELGARAAILSQLGIRPPPE